MDKIQFFDTISYVHQLAEKNKLCKAGGYLPCTCSGIDSLEGILQNFKKSAAFVCVDDTNDSSTMQQGGGYFTTRMMTIFIIKRYKFGDMDDRNKALDECRQIARQFKTKMIKDSHRLEDDLVYLNTARFLSREIGQYFVSGCTGCYFMVDFNEPTDLQYNEDEWEE